jgi:flagellar hook-length control protein FliK
MAGAANILDAAPAAAPTAAAPAAAAPGTTPAFDAVLLLQNMVASAETLDTAELEAGETGDLLGGSDDEDDENGDDLEASLAFLTALLTAAPPRTSTGDMATGGQGAEAESEFTADATPTLGEDGKDFLLKQDKSEKLDLLNLATVKPEALDTRAAGDASQNLARAVEMLSQSQRAAPAAVTDTVLTHARDPRWADDFNNRVSLLVRGGESTASLSMTPLDLGPVEVNVTVKESQATIQFSASQADTRALIEASLPKLRELLAAQGFNLSDASVSSGFSRSQQQASAHASRGAADADAGVSEVQVTRQLGLLDLYA